MTSLAVEPDSTAIVRSAVELGHALGHKVVAEGVEDEGALAELKATDCDYAQGYLIGRPMTASLLVHWVQQRESRAAAAV